MAARVRRHDDAALRHSEVARQDVQPDDERQCEQHRQRRQQVQDFAQRQGREVERGIPPGDRIHPSQRHRMSRKGDELVQVPERRCRGHAEHDRNGQSDAAKQLRRDGLRDLEVPDPARQVDRADRPIHRYRVSGVPGGRDQERSRLPENGTQQERLIAVALPQVGEPGVLGESKRDPATSEQGDEYACHDQDGRAPPLHATPARTPAAASTSSASFLMRSSCSAVGASNRRTRIGCVFDARISPHPLCARHRTPSIVVVS